MIELLLAVGVVVALVLLLWDRLFGEPDSPDTKTLVQKRRDSLEMKRNLALLRRAHTLAKDELGRNPTVDEIFMTRDALREKEKLNG